MRGLLHGWSLLFLVVASTNVYGLTFERYHTQQEINAYLRQIAADHPAVVQFRELGLSANGREISYVTISKGAPESLPAIYLNGTHHGNEKSSTEAVLGVLKILVDNQHTIDVSQLLESYTIYIQPLVNPDGHAVGSRYDARGRDPNRDYAHPDRPERQAFKIPSIQYVRALADRVKFRAAVAYHSGMEGVLWPWCHTKERNDDHDLFYTLSKKTALAMGMRTWAQSYRDYPTRGEFIDYVYWAHGTLGLTFEVSNVTTPKASELAKVVERSIAGTMAFL